jgi:phenylacetate-CoA ligase
MQIPSGSGTTDVPVLDFFHEVARRVPAYADFLRTHGIVASAINRPEALAEVPFVDKVNYLMQYDMGELCWDGDLFRSDLVSVSSGSSGEPYFWPRGRAQAVEGGILLDRIFTDSFDSRSVTSLVVICFSMGAWIAGTFTLESVLGLAQRGHKLHVATPGLEKAEAVRVVHRLAANYDQVVIAGYPPFVKDILDLGVVEGVDWRTLRVRLLLGGESFSEEWRDHVLSYFGDRADLLRDVINIYASADAAILGHETSQTIALRRTLWARPDAVEQVFGPGPLPSLVSVDMRQRHFESEAGELLLTASAGLPLVRYNFHDRGNVHAPDDFAEAGSVSTLIESSPHERFVSIHGRSDHTATIYAVNVYPESIKIALLHPKIIQLASGKFQMATRNEPDHSQFLELVIEQPNGHHTSHSDALRIREVIHTELQRTNAEYRKLHSAIGEKAIPQVVLTAYGDAAYFGESVKQRWVARNA